MTIRKPLNLGKEKLNSYYTVGLRCFLNNCSTAYTVYIAYTSYAFVRNDSM